MEKMEYKGSVFRVRKCAFDLLSLEDDLVDEDGCDDEWWEMIERDLRLKSTFLYCDLNKVISNTHDEHKEAFTTLANKLFYYMEEVSFGHLHTFPCYFPPPNGHLLWIYDPCQ